MVPLNGDNHRTSAMNGFNSIDVNDNNDDPSNLTTTTTTTTTTAAAAAAAAAIDDDNDDDDDTDYEKLLDVLAASERLALLALKLQGSDGVDIKDRRYHLKIYKDCFIGRELVSHLMTTGEVNSVIEALDVGNKMLKSGIFHHVTNEWMFCDAYLFYRFSPMVNSFSSPRAYVEYLMNRMGNMSRCRAVIRNQISNVKCLYQKSEEQAYVIEVLLRNRDKNHKDLRNIVGLIIFPSFSLCLLSLFFSNQAPFMSAIFLVVWIPGLMFLYQLFNQREKKGIDNYIGRLTELVEVDEDILQNIRSSSPLNTLESSSDSSSKKYFISTQRNTLSTDTASNDRSSDLCRLHEYESNSELRSIAIQDLWERIIEQRRLSSTHSFSYIPEPSDEQRVEMVMHLRCKKYNLVKAFNSMMSAMMFRRAHVDFFSTHVPPDLLSTIMKTKVYSLLPAHDLDDRVLFVFVPGRIDLRLGNLELYQRVGYIMALFALRMSRTQLKGLLLVIDFVGFDISVLRQARPADIKLGVGLVQDYLAIRVGRVLLVRQPRWISILLGTIKPFIRGDQSQTIISIGDSMEKLLSFVSREQLPASLNGTLHFNEDACMEDWLDHYRSSFKSNMDVSFSTFPHPFPGHSIDIDVKTEMT